MTPEDRHDLLDEANKLAYQYIRLSGLSGMLKTNDDDDVLAEQIAERVMALVEGIVGAVKDEIEAQGYVKAAAADVSAVIHQYGKAA